ncbi:histidine phosphatase family protein [Peribacillus deserti]|uniref:Histidine phosphatase family protein n=1 Tax=Peribacillus deserti TaxID=673318 RepID=A0A2N5M8X6_9BACI|nr:histidine phosphatase family protein [Peribacillus deserti]PLT30814.1 histidine phosphatase family protein [Peribacillus deserti]
MESSRIIDLYLIRHGLTQWNIEKRYQGHTDIPLHREKVSELNILKDWVLEGILADAVYSSDLARCMETARFLWPDSPIIKDSRLRELNFGEWEGLTFDDLKNSPLYTSWIADWEEHSPPEGESARQFNDRVDGFMNSLIAKKQNFLTIAAVTHGGVIRRIISRYVPEVTFWEIPIPFGKAYQLKLEEKGAGWICSSLSVVPIQERESM